VVGSEDRGTPQRADAEPTFAFGTLGVGAVVAWMLPHDARLHAVMEFAGEITGRGPVAEGVEQRSVSSDGVASR